MKRYIAIFLALFVVGSLFIGCVDDQLLKPISVGDEVAVDIKFGSIEYDPIEIKSRGTYDLHYESMVRNMYVLLFVDGKRIYGRYLDNDDLNKTENKEYWTVTNMPSDDHSRSTSGTLHLCMPSVSSGAELIIVANIDLDFMNLSEDRLGLIRTKEELSQLIISMNQDLPERNAGYFMMQGSASGVSIDSNGSITIPNGKVFLKRLDAKVNVNVRINPNEQSNGQKVEQFVPRSWQVMNMPKNCLLLPSANGIDATNATFFSTEPKNFETTEEEIINGVNTGGVLYGFSFYTLENLKSNDKKKSVDGNYHNRDRRLKYNDDQSSDNYGTYNTENGMWEYAPELATYMIIKGELQMVVDPGETTEQHLVADVTYYVHLGDFASNKDNYDLKRNTYYDYTINIKGVDNIVVEVETSNENQDGITEAQPGAMGHIYDAEDDIFTFDAHYGQRVYTIRASDIDVEHMTWYVMTPFGREGVPQKDANGQEIYNDLDYKWVEFMLNDKQGNGRLYSSSNMRYPSDKTKLMTVIDVLNLIKVETLAWQKNEPNKYDENDEMKFTVFVNEFYYDSNPMNPNDNNILWKRFVNQPNRLMHILCKNQRSKDGDSSVTGSIITIRQRSIQTPYNINLGRVDLTEGWGCETVDETNNMAWFYSPRENMNSGSTYKITSYTPDNTSPSDGLYNTACLLNLTKGTTSKSLNTTLRWDTFIDYSGSDLKLKADYTAGLYSVLLRNRDLDGDGIIDPDELRWYIASLNQLSGLFLGDQGLSSEAKLYPIAASREPNAPVTSGAFQGVYPWRLHVVSSTAFNHTAGNMPIIVWAEEGASTGEYQQHYNKPAYSPVRCVRNLGTSLPTASTILVSGANYPKDELIIVNRPNGNINSNSVYRFDFRNMNEESLRYYTTRELVPGDEYSMMSRLYYGFETGPLLNNYPIGNNASPYIALKSHLENGVSYAPTNGYRVPNVREGVVMSLYCGADANWWGNSGTLVNNYYSFGYYGNDYDVSGTSHFYSWFIYRDRVTLGGVGETISYVRYVRDWNPQ